MVPAATTSPSTWPTGAGVNGRSAARSTWRRGRSPSAWPTRRRGASVTEVTSVGLPGYGRWRFVGSDAAEVLRGGTAALVARGGGGNDRLLGSTKDDVLLGGPGRDEVHGRAGDDRCRAERTRSCESP